MSKNSQLNIRIESELKEQLEAIAEQEERSVAWVTSKAIKMFLESGGVDQLREAPPPYITAESKKKAEKVGSEQLRQHLAGRKPRAAKKRASS